LSLLLLEARQKKEKKKKRKITLALSLHEFWVLLRFFSWYKSSCNSRMGIERTIVSTQNEHLEQMQMSRADLHMVH
jgi:hypothetical protein